MCICQFIALSVISIAGIVIISRLPKVLQLLKMFRMNRSSGLHHDTIEGVQP